jgi:hypothetical protein
MKYLKLFEELDNHKELDRLILGQLSELMAVIGYELSERVEPDRVIIETVGMFDEDGDEFPVRVELVPMGTVEALDRDPALLDMIGLGLQIVDFAIRLDIIAIDEDSTGEPQADLSITVDLTPDGAKRIESTIEHLVNVLAESRQADEIAYRIDYGAD